MRALTFAQTIDLPISKLDLSIDATAAQCPSGRATLAPKHRMTWGSVRRFADEVVLQTGPQ